MDGKRHRKNPRVVVLGEARFPFGLASTQRIILLGKALLEEGIKVTVVCRKGSWPPGKHENFSVQGTYEGIDYIYTSKTIHKPNGFIKRTRQKLKGIYGEYQFLKQLGKQDGISMAILSNRNAIHVARYLFLAALLGFPLVLNLVEMASSMQHKKPMLTKLGHFLFDKWLINFFQGALPISDTLMDFYSSKAPDKPVMKIPILCDFDLFNLPKDRTKEPYFLYCGSLDYGQVRDFVIEAYSSLSSHSGYKLYMIISSENKFSIGQLFQKLQMKFDMANVKIVSNISYQELVGLYLNAKALLIPLRNNVQDTARFPHKIGEYLASGNPVITTDVGEIKNYFTDGKTALIAKNYSIEEFAKKMRMVIDEPDKSTEIGLNGRELGLREFHYKIQGKRLRDFMNNVFVKV